MVGSENRVKSKTSFSIMSKNVKCYSSVLKYSPTRFVKELIDRTISNGATECFWSMHACESHSDFDEFRADFVRLSKHHWSDVEIKAFIRSFKIHKKLFDQDRRQMMFNTINFVECGFDYDRSLALPAHQKHGGHDRKVRRILRDLEAQGLFSIDHKVSLDDNLTKLCDSVSYFFNGISVSGLKTTLIRFMLLIFELMSNSSMSSKLRMALSFLLDFDWSGCITTVNDYAMVLAQVLERLCSQAKSKFYKKEIIVEAQSYINEPMPVESLLIGTVRLFASMLKVEFSSDRSISDIKVNTMRVKRLEELSKTVTSLEKIWKFVYHLFQESFDELGEYLGIVKPYPEILSKINKEIPDWMSKVSVVTSEDKIGSVARDYRLAMECVELKKQGDQYCMELQKLKVPPACFAYFNTFYSEIKKMAKDAAPHYFNDKMRKSPFVLHLFGNSGIGKSTVQNFIIKELMHRMEYPFDPARDVYVRNNAQDHWDGYVNQPVVILDDFMQIRDKEIIERELAELIHIKNTTAYPLKMASLDDKGNTRFTSNLVIISSNADFGDNPELRNYITCPSAIKRRRDVVARVMLKKKHTDNTGKLNVSSLENPEDRFDCSIYGFKMVDNPNIYNYSAFVDYCVNKWRLVEKDDVALIDGLPTWTVSNLEPKIVNSACEYDERKIEAQAFFSNSFEEEDDDAFEDCIDEVEYAVSVGSEEPLSHWTKRAKDYFYTLLDRGHGIKSKFNGKIEQFKCSMKSWYDKACDIEVPWYKAGLAFLGALSAVTSSFLLYKYLTKDCGAEAEAAVSGDSRTKTYKNRFLVGIKETERSAEASISGDAKTKRYIKRFDTTAAEARIDRKLYNESVWDGQSLEANASSDPNAHTIIANCIYNNLGRIKVGSCEVNGLFICDTIFLIPRHILLAFEYTQDFTIRTRIHVHNVSLSECEVKVDEKMDVAFLRLPVRVGTYVNIIHHFHDIDDLERVRLDLAVLCTTRMIKDSAAMFLMMCHKVAPRGKIDYPVRNDDGSILETINLVHGYEYLSQMQRGDCGSPIVALHPAMQKKILGIHVAGGQNYGISNVLTQKYMRAMVAQFKDVIKPHCPLLNPDRIELTAHCALDTNDRVEVWGSLNKELQFRCPEKSDIYPSPLHGLFPVKTAPAVLKPINGKNPMRLGIEGQFCDNICFPQSVVDQAVQDLFTSIASLDSPYVGMKVLPEHAIINGMAGDPWIRPLNLKTSPGFPYIHIMRDKPGKFSFVEGEEGEYKPDSFLQCLVDKREQMAYEGEIPFTLFCDTLKDERRTFDKIAECKTRVFNTAPLDLNLLVRKYFLPFIAHLEHNHVKGECSVGINAHSDSWTHLFNHLNDGGDKWIAGDFSKYDKTLSFQLIMGALDIINRFYDDSENDIIRKTLFCTMFNAFHLCGSHVYRVHQGNPSGIPLTVIINSLVNSLLSRIVFLLLAEREGLHYGMQDFHKFVRVKNYGDDNIGKVSKRCLWYNMNNIASCLIQYGIKYTPPTKGDITTDFLELEDVSYLKRRFVKDSLRVWAPLERQSIEEMLMWVRGKEADMQLCLEMTYESAIREMVHYGVDEFDKFQKYVHNFACRRGIKLPTFSYKQLLQDFTEGIYFGVDLI